MPNWTVNDIPPQTGKLAIVTGATGGLGFETALGLAQAGADADVLGALHRVEDPDEGPHQHRQADRLAHLLAERDQDRLRGPPQVGSAIHWSIVHRWPMNSEAIQILVPSTTAAP